MSVSVWGVDHGEEVSKYVDPVGDPKKKHYASRPGVYNTKSQNVKRGAWGGGVVGGLSGAMTLSPLATVGGAALGAGIGAGIGASQKDKHHPAASARRGAYDQRRKEFNTNAGRLNRLEAKFGDKEIDRKTFRQKAKKIRASDKASVKQYRQNKRAAVGKAFLAIPKPPGKIKSLVAKPMAGAKDFAGGAKAGFQGRLKASPNKTVPSGLRSVNAGARAGQIAGNRNVQIGAGAGAAGMTSAYAINRKRN